ncbi:phospholipid carrier-dependent glycosyltransferase [Nitriliruptor alkaliphilus]|uniref:phospholipid carrier-dependent glycosyltransferase n=1 Tax=Nitriliruptor alkaliphilus TaxID=427918 RepID=UPI0012ECDD04|nr:phospholipid carrier-dependent glycosyltransferase [Nitriliruptor alkaliphilus]
MTRRRRSAAIVATLAVAASAAAVALTHLGTPPGIVFDEAYYVGDARAMLATGVDDGFAVHPPLGKWVIALGITVVGDSPVGWRIGGALLAVLAVAATVELGRRLTGRIGLGVVAGALVALDGVWLTLARMAMLDAALAALVTLGTLALVVDHQRATSRASDVTVRTGRDAEGVSAGHLVAPRVSRAPLVAAGILFGLATATKWSGLLALGGAGLLAAGWELAARRRRATERLGPREVARAAAPVALALIIAPIAVYALSWVPWLVGYPASHTAAAQCEPIEAAGGTCDPSLGDRVAGLARHHGAVLRFHTGLDADHPYRAPATTWPTQHRPVVAHYESCDEDGTHGEDGEPCLGVPGKASEVAILGNPALWWSALVLVPLAAAALRRREGTAVVPLVMLGAQYLPWLVVARPVFSFYTAPLVPALALAVVIAGAELDRSARRLVTLPIGAGAAIVAGATASLLGAATPTAVAVAVLGATAGTGVGGVIDGRRGHQRGVPDPARPLGTTISWLVLAAAVALFVYFSPLWYGVPVDEAVLRQRWWLHSWV